MYLLRPYLADSRYNYRIKTVEELDADMMDRLERALAKYVPIDISEVQKTIFQKNPLDFKNVTNREVYIVDVTLEYPAAPVQLQHELKVALGLPESYIVVRGEGDPLEVENQRLDALDELDAAAEKADMAPASLMSVPDYPEAAEIDGADYYGAGHNSRLISKLKEIEDERRAKNAVVADNAPKPFDWVEREPKQSAEDFNADHHPELKGKDIRVNRAGHVDDSIKDVKRTYRTAGGSKVTKTAKAATTGKDK